MDKENIGNRDISMIKLSDNLKVPTAIRNAINKIKEIGFIPNQCLLLDVYSRSTTYSENVICQMGYEDSFFSIGWHNVEDEGQIEKMKNWKNFDCIWYYHKDGRCLSKFNIETDDIDFAMKFLTDLFIYLNPAVRIEDVSVALDFAEVANALGEGAKGMDYEYHFYPDGTESSTEQFMKCVGLLDRYKIAP